MTRPAILSSNYWSAKRGAILVGFVLTILGTLGTQFYVQPPQDLSAALDHRAKELLDTVDTLTAAQAQYLMFQQQGSLIYALNVAALSSQPNQKSIVDRLYQISLIDRSVAMETIIGELGKVNIVDFKSQRDTYLAMIEAAQKDMSLDTYTKIDEFEKGVMSKASTHMTDLQKNLAEVTGAKAIADAAADQRKLTLLILTTVGSTFLLAANLLSTRETSDKTTTKGSEELSDQRVLELTTAQQVLAIALEHVKRMDDPPPPR